MQLRMGDRGAVDLGFEQGQLHGHGPWGGGRRRILQDGGASTGPKATGRRNVIPGGPASTASFLPLPRSEEHTSELQSLMRISYAVFCLKKKKYIRPTHTTCPKHTPN